MGNLSPPRPTQLEVRVVATSIGGRKATYNFSPPNRPRCAFIVYGDNHNNASILLSYPRLRSFITVRREYFGGYVYNPFLLQQVALNPLEMDIVQQLDGQNSTEQILGQQSDGAQSASTIDGLLFELLRKLQNLYAIEWNSSGASCPSTTQEKSTSLKRGVLSAPLSVLWDVTYACNLHCSHCLSSSGSRVPNELTTTEATHIIDQLADAKVFTINFCGGEPLMRRDLTELMQHASSYNLGLKLSTNGTLVSEEWLKAIEDTNLFGVQVSLDGRQDVHDALRGKEGCFARATRAIQLLVEAGYFTVVAPVVTRANVGEMEEVLETAIELGASAFKPSLFLPSGRGEKHRQNLSPPLEKIRELMAKLSRKKQEYEEQIAIVLDAAYPVSNSDCSVSGSCPKSNSPVGCSAGNTQLVITADGNVVVCPFLYDFVAGNLRKEKLVSIWDESPAFAAFRGLEQRDLKGRCRSCSQIPDRCQGGCRAAAYLVSGDLYAEDPICWFQATDLPSQQRVAYSAAREPDRRSEQGDRAAGP